jgi:methylated-DNA-[protein]-cysteine S-methyltransferase
MTSSTPGIARARRNPTSDSPSNGSTAGRTNVRVGTAGSVADLHSVGTAGGVADLDSVDTPIGRLWLVRDEYGLSRVEFAGPERARSRDGLLREAADQLHAYFARELERFELPLSPGGTDFQRRVWAAVAAIPYGATTTYAALAASLGNPAACRAVGAANGRNPLAIVVPCHRVVGSAGALTGYGGGLERKRALLDLEAGAS